MPAYTYKQQKNEEDVVVLHAGVHILHAGVAVTTHGLRRFLRRRAPEAGPELDAEETPNQEVVTSRESHQPRKAESSLIRNIGQRSPLSLFNAESGANANPLFIR